MGNFNVCLAIIMIVLIFCVSVIIEAKEVLCTTQINISDKNAYKEIINLKNDSSKCKHSLDAAIKAEKANESAIKKKIKKLSLRLLEIEGKFGDPIEGSIRNELNRLSKKIGNLKILHRLMKDICYTIKSNQARSFNRQAL